MDKTTAKLRPRDCCPLCQSSALNDYLTLDGIRIAKCAACEFMFSRDTLNATEIDQFYIDGYHDRRHMDGQKVNASVNFELFQRFCPDPTGKSVLDIGSGYGFFLARLRDGGTQRIAGVELSQAQRRYSVDELHLQVYGQLEELTENEQFDVITLFEVIEHIPAPHEFIQKVCAHLKVGGSLIVGTDNFVSDVVTVLGAGFPKWIPHEHVSFFTPKSLQDTLTRTGQLTFSAARSYTSWELLLRKLVFRATSGRKGGKQYSYQSEQRSGSDRGFRFFALRLAANRSWYKLTERSDLNGEMMYLHMVKS